MGQIYLRKRMWYSNYSIDGKRIRKPLSPNQRIAQSMQDELATAARYHANGLIPSKMSYDLFRDKYLKFSKANNRPNTYAHDKIAFNRLEEFRSVRYLDEITPELLEDAKIWWKEEGYGPAAIGSYVMRLKVAMKMAENWRYVRIQPWRIVEDFVSPGKIIYYDSEQLGRCIKIARGKWLTALLLMARAGLRSGEVRHLMWEDINFKERTLWIRSKPCSVCKPCRHRNMWRPKGWTPKKPHERLVDMPDDLEAHLKRLPQRPGFVVWAVPVSESYYANKFREIIGLAGLRGSAHAFRHTYASWLISSGRSTTLEEVGILLGHTNPITTRMYAHLMPHARRRAVDGLPPLVPNL